MPRVALDFGGQPIVVSGAGFESAVAGERLVHDLLATEARNGRLAPGKIPPSPWLSRCGAIDSGAAFDPLRRRHDLAVSAVLPHPELVDEHELLRVVLVVADAAREEVHVLRNHERHPR